LIPATEGDGKTALFTNGTELVATTDAEPEQIAASGDDLLQV